MAEFSKQYCQTHDMGFDGDFDILEEWNKIQPGYCVALICEGYGFTSICKTENGEECLLYFPDGFYKDDTPNHHDLGVHEGTHWVDFFSLNLM